MDEKVFQQRLKETIAWCTRDPSLPKCTEYIVPPGIWSDTSKLPKLSKSAEYLRTPTLQPPVWDDGETSLFLASSSQSTTAIEAMSCKRTKLLADERLMAQGTTGLAGGRLLAYFLGASGHDGLSASITDYFDHEDNPPWDTWIGCIAGKDLKGPNDKPFDFRVVLGQNAFSADYVLSWVPPVWIEDVEAVTHYQSTGALMWADTLVARPEKYAIYDFHRCYIPAWLERYTTA